MIYGIVFVESCEGFRQPSMQSISVGFFDVSVSILDSDGRPYWQRGKETQYRMFQTKIRGMNRTQQEFRAYKHSHADTLTHMHTHTILRTAANWMMRPYPYDATIPI